MSMDIVVPQVSDGVDSGTVIAVAVSEGDQVEADQTLIELETDKAVVAIPSPAAGKIVALKVETGQQVAVGAVIAVLAEDSGHAADDIDSSAETREQQGQEKETSEEATEGAAEPTAEADSDKTEATAAAPAGRDLVVIGAGPGGYAAAFRAAALGLTVTLVDPAENPGGVCLYRGCIPSKALLHAAKMITDADEAAAIGVSFAAPEIDIERLRAWKDDVIGRLTGGLGAKAEKLKVTRLRGTARFRDSHRLEVTDPDGNTSDLEFSQAIIATGSRPIMLPGVPADSQRIVDSTGALALREVPDSLLVVGGGYIGLELGSAYAAFGSKVTVVEMTDGLLPGCDRDLVSVLKRRLDGVFAEILLKTRVVELKEQKNGVAVTLEDKKGKQSGRRFDQVLIAVGRRPNTESLECDKAGVTVDEKGFVKVDGQQRTSRPHIFAIGDIAGEPMLAHKAYAEAEVAARVAAGEKAVYEPRAIPAVVFTDPEVAWCGLTETAAREQKIKVKTAKLPWRSNGRCLTLGRDNGMTKLIVDAESDRILGVAVAGPGAGELIAEGVLAMEMAAVSEDLRATIHPHPTLAETLYEAAQMLT